MAQTTQQKNFYVLLCMLARHILSELSFDLKRCKLFISWDSFAKDKHSFTPSQEQLPYVPGRSYVISF